MADNEIDSQHLNFQVILMVERNQRELLPMLMIMKMVRSRQTTVLLFIADVTNCVLFCMCISLFLHKKKHRQYHINQFSLRQTIFSYLFCHCLTIIIVFMQSPKINRSEFNEFLIKRGYMNELLSRALALPPLRKREKTYFLIFFFLCCLFCF